MRVSSLKKIELQAKAWFDRTWNDRLLGESHVEEMQRLNGRYYYYLNKWSTIEKSHCALHNNGNRCTCDAIPEPLQEIRRKLKHTSDRINALYTKERECKQALYQPYYRRLIEAREAKLKYLKEH